MLKKFIWQKVVLLLVALITGFSWWGLGIMEHTNKIQIGQALQAVLETSNQAYSSWAQSQKATALVWAQHPRMIELIRRLTAVGNDQGALIGHPALKEIRELLAPVLTANDFQGFFLIGPGNINIASSRDTNLGWKNLLAKQPDILERLWRGEPQLTRPQYSDVPLQSERGPSVFTPTQFVGAPILNEQGVTIAVLTFRIDPNKDFSRIFTRGRIGEKGETYAFDKAGLLLSQSRFEGLLRKIGLLKTDTFSSLNISIRDPGRNLLKQPLIPGQPQNYPLTLMAREATAGRSGMNLEGYRDYRGVEVLGAWIWNVERQFGITTEIDKEEAYQTLNVVRVTVFSMTVLSIFIVLGLTVSFLRTRRVMMESEQNYRSLIEDSPLGMILYQGGRPILANQAFATLFEFGSVEEIFEKGDLMPFIKPHADGTEVGRPPSPSETETSSRRLNNLETKTLGGSPLYLEVFERQMNWMGKPVHARTFVNTTERTILEKQLRQSQKMEAVGRLAGGVAHDFNNNLQIMRGYTEMIDAAMSPGAHKADLNHVLSAIDSAAHLTRQLLSFSRQDTLLKQPLCLNELVENKVSFFSRVIRGDITLSLDLRAKPSKVYADAVMIEQNLLNLCINAQDAMPKGGELTVGTDNFFADESFSISRSGIAPGSYVLMSVTDTGTGMTPEIRDRIFEPFFTTKEAGKGTGLGLSTVYGIILQHNGWVDLYSEPGKGTSFKTYLPLLDEQVDATAITKQPPQVKGGTETILVAEDDEQVRNLVEKLLQSLGYQVLLAVNGEEAINLFQGNEHRIQLVLLDMVMPKMNGREVFDWIKKRAPEMPVLFSTGYTRDIIDLKFIEQNRISVLRKPYSKRDLAMALRQNLDQRPSENISAS